MKRKRPPPSPSFAVVIDGIVNHDTQPQLATTPPLGKKIKRTHDRTPKSVTWDERDLKYWPTPRSRGGAYRKRLLTPRNSKDLGTVMFHERDYVERFPNPDTRGIVSHPEFVEWMQGLPTHWTSTTKVPRPLPPVSPHRMRGLDLFTGCGGLTLGLHPWVNTVGYCDCEHECRAIISARVESGHLDAPSVRPDDGLVFPDVRTLDPSLFDVDIVVAGFPCQNISALGDRMGIHGEKTGLFHQVARIVAGIKPPLVFLENVSRIVCAHHATTLTAIVKAFDDMGYDARWGIFKATHVGAPHHRSRWFFLATRRGVDVTHLTRHVPSISTAEQREMARTFPVEPSVRLAKNAAAVERCTARLRALGNAVCAPQAALAFRYLIKVHPESESAESESVESVESVNSVDSVTPKPPTGSPTNDRPAALKCSSIFAPPDGSTGVVRKSGTESPLFVRSFATCADRRSTTLR